MADLKNGQTCLEKYSIEERNKQLEASDYSPNDPYGATHEDAKSTGTLHGKGTGGGSHGFSLPQCASLATSQAIDYSNFNTTEGGNCIDEAMRDRNTTRSLYGKDYPYNQAVDTSANVEDGQFVVEFKRGTTNCNKWLAELGLK